MSLMMLMTPACLILICGFPTFHCMAVTNTRFRSCWLSGESAYLSYSNYITYSINTRVSIRVSRSHWGFTRNSNTSRMSGRKRRTSLRQFRTIASNLKRFLLVRFQFVYYLLLSIRYRIGPISAAWSSYTVAYPLLVASRSKASTDCLRLGSGMVLVAWRLTNIWYARWMNFSLVWLTLRRRV